MIERPSAAVGGALAFLTALVGAATHVAAEDACRVRDVVYNGWQCVELSNGRVDVVVAPQLGGRIIQLRLGAFEYLWVNRELAGKVVRYPDVAGSKTDAGAAEKKGEAKPIEWANYGGDKLWPAPQGWSGPNEWPGPPDPVAKGGRTDHGLFQLQVLRSGPDEAAVRLIGPRDLYAGIRFTREIRIRPRTTTIELKAIMTNISDRPVRWGIWQVTQHAARAGSRGLKPAARELRAWAPVNPKSRYGKGYRVMFGAEDNPQFAVDDTFQSAIGRRLFRLSYDYRVGKVGLDCDAGWLAVTDQKSEHLYAHTFPAEPDKPHPDDACVEFWASGLGTIKTGDAVTELGPDQPWLVESEVLSPFASLEPGRRCTYSTKLHLARAKGPVVAVTQAAAVLAPVRRNTDGGLRGRIAVFDDGTLRVAGLPDRAPVPLDTVQAGQVADLGKLGQAAGLRLPKTPANGAGRAVIQLLAADGRVLVGEAIR